MEESAFNNLCLIVNIGFIVIAAYSVYLYRSLKKIQKESKELNRLYGEVYDKYHYFLRAELNYIYKKTNVLPYEEKKRLDEFFGSNDYVIYPPKELK